MGQLVNGIKAVIRLGGTGVPYTTDRRNDVVYSSMGFDARTYAGINVTADRALTYIPFFAAVRDIAEDVGSLPLHVYRDLEGGGKAPDPAHPLDAVLHDNANPYMTAQTFREVLTGHVLTWGNGYAEKEFATDGSIMALWPLRPDRMEPLVDRDSNALYYRYQLNVGGYVDLRPEQVFHIRGFGYDGLKGYSVIEKAASTLGVALAGTAHAGKGLERGVVPPAYMKHPATLSEEARQRLRDDWDEIDHTNRMAILEEGLDIHTLGIPARDAQYIETMDLQRSLMATLFRMPPHMLGDVSRSTSWGTGIEQQDIEYVKYALRSYLVRWESEGKRQLLSGEDRFLKHAVEGFLRGDTKTRWEAYSKGLDTGIYNLDEVRAYEDLNPLPDGMGQLRRLPLNFAPLDQWADASLLDRLEMLRKLTGEGFEPEAAAEAVDVPPIEHTGLEPVAVAEQGQYIGNGNGQEPG